jgi:chaperone modulatory protein CbpM
MSTNLVVRAVIVDDETLTLDDLARVCHVGREWVVERVQSGLLGSHYHVTERSTWRFVSTDVLRARRLAQMERDMDANPELAALVADLIDEVHTLRRRLRAAGVTD